MKEISGAWHFRTTMTEEDSKWIAGCPAIDIVSVGDSEAEARKKLDEHFHLFMQTLIEEGTLVEVFESLGLFETESDNHFFQFVTEHKPIAKSVTTWLNGVFPIRLGGGFDREPVAV